jgi:nitric oxide reductase subunit C
MAYKRLFFGTFVLAFAVYSVMVYTATPNLQPQRPLTGSAAHGQQLYQEYNCVACHQFFGLGGYMGPDLTNVASEKGTAYARAYLASGSLRMPDFNLSEAEIESLVDFLVFVDGSGQYPAEHHEIYWNGAYVESGS